MRTSCSPPRSSASAIPSWDELLASGSGLELPGCSFPMSASFEESSEVSTPASSVTFLPSPIAFTSASGSTSANRPPRCHKRKAETRPLPLPSMSAAMAASSLTGNAKTPRPSVPAPAAETGGRGSTVGRWTKKEHELFLEGLQRFGKSWKKISSLVHSRTLVQIRTHAQKFLQKQSRAALKAEAKAAASRDAQQSALPMPPLPEPTPTPTASTWKPRPDFQPLAFPSVLSGGEASSSVASSDVALSVATPRSAFALSGGSKLDQLLQDDPGCTSVPAFVDDYYSSPTAIEDDLLRPLGAGEPQWVPRLTLSGVSGLSGSNKRRRLEPLDAHAGVSMAPLPPTPTLRPPPSFSGSFESLVAPHDDSAATYAEQSPAALLAAHETQAGPNYCTPWL